MTKYIIESDIDFYAELSKIDSSDDVELNNTCLITNMPLTDNSVKLICGHMFNYVPLFNDIRNHKIKFNNMESTAGTLKLNEIRCPYCRNIQTGVLPYYEELGVQLMNGVNMYDPKLNIYGDYTKCQFITENPEFNPNQPEDPITNIKSYPCSCYGTKIVIFGVPNDNEWGDKKIYCRQHKKIMIRNYKKDAIMKAKEEAKKLKDQAKAEAKAEAKKAKDQAKAEAKQAKVEAKDQAKKESVNLSSGVNASTTQNVVKKLHNANNHVKCIAILKSGVNKGSECGCVALSGVYCKRHTPS
jgi:hypothetical protein